MPGPVGREREVGGAGPQQAHRPARNGVREQCRLVGDIVLASCARRCRRPARGSRRPFPARRPAPSPAPCAGRARLGCGSRLPAPPSRQTAMAHEGATDACAMYGRSTSVAMRRPSAASTSPLTTISSGVEESTAMAARRLAGTGAPVVHVASRCANAIARTATSSRSAMTPTNDPSRTICTPGNARRSAASSNVARRRSRAGGSRTRPCSIPSSSMSWMKPAPAALAARSTRGMDVPTSRRSDGAFGRAWSMTGAARSTEGARDQYVRSVARPLTTMRPSSTLSVSAGACSSLAASASRSARTADAARRTARPPVSIERLLDVPASSGPSAVCPGSASRGPARRRARRRRSE